MKETIAIIIDIIGIIVNMIALKYSMRSLKIAEDTNIPVTKIHASLRNKEGKNLKLKLLFSLSFAGMLLPILVIIYTFVCRPEFDKITLFLASISFFVLSFSVATYQNVLNAGLISQLSFLMGKGIELQGSQITSTKQLLEAQSLLADRVSKLENSE